MNETFLTEKSRAEYRDLPSADFTVEDVMAGGRTRIRLDVGCGPPVRLLR